MDVSKLFICCLTRDHSVSRGDMLKISSEERASSKLEKEEEETKLESYRVIKGGERKRMGKKKKARLNSNIRFKKQKKIWRCFSLFFVFKAKQQTFSFVVKKDLTLLRSSGFT